MGTVNGSVIAPGRVLFFPEFFEGVYVPWVQRNREPSTYKGYKDLWRDHLRSVTGVEKILLKNIRTFNVQNCIDDVAVTMSYYVKPLDQDVCDGMDRLEQKVNEVRDTDGTVN